MRSFRDGMAVVVPGAWATGEPGVVMEVLMLAVVAAGGDTIGGCDVVEENADVAEGSSDAFEDALVTL